MKSKLTLTLDKDTIKQLKELAGSKGKSLSEFFEDFISDFQNETIERKKKYKFNKLIKLIEKSPPLSVSDVDHKELYHKKNIRKYNM